MELIKEDELEDSLTVEGEYVSEAYMRESLCWSECLHLPSCYLLFPFEFQDFPEFESVFCREIAFWLEGITSNHMPFIQGRESRL